MPMQARPDGSFVRAVPGTYAQREPRALLPASAQSLDEFVPVPGGKLGRRREVTQLRSLVDEAGIADDLDVSMLEAPAVKGTRGKALAEPMTRPAAIADREFEGARVTRTVFSSDPSAVDAPMITLSGDDAHELRRMLAEMENIEYTSRTFNEIPVGRGGSYEVVAGGAGARVYDDIARDYGSSKPTRAAVTEGIRQALEGKHSALAQRALATARGRQAGDPWLSRPQLPDDAGDLPQSGKLTDADFSEFDRYVNRLASEGTEDLGGLAEAGAVNPLLAARIGGGVVGAATGAATGDEDDSTAKRVLRGVVGGALGAAAPSLLRSGRPGLVLRGQRIDRAPQGQPGAVTGTLRAGQADDATFPTTARTAPSPERLHRDPLAGTEVFVSKFAPELQTGIREVLERNAGFEAQRRGVVTPETTAALAEGIAVDVARRLKPGTSLPAEGVRRFADGIATAQSTVNELAAKVNRGQAVDADVLALDAAKAEVATLTASLMGARAEAGRALAEFKVLARVLSTGNPKLIAHAAERLRGEAAQFAEAFAQLPNDPVARYRWLQQQRAPGLREKARQMFYANILSGLKTHERNSIGNAANAVANLAVYPVAVGADVVRSKLTGAPRELFFSELPSQAAGAVVGLRNGFSNALFALKHGVNRSALTQSLSAAEAGKLDVPRIEFAGGLSNPFNWPGRALDAEDQFFRGIARDTELYGAAHAHAKREGLRGTALQDRMAQLVSGTDEISQGIQATADAFARRTVFQETPGRFTRAVQGALKAVPELSYVMPFVKTPANIVRQGLEFSPAGFAMPAARQPGRAGAQALGRATTGTVALGGLAYLAATGKLSGSGPKDATARAQLMESGWRPNSVKVGDSWVSYSLFQPLSVPMAIIANGFEAWRAAGANAGQADAYAGQALTAVGQTLAKSGRSLLDQSFLSGLADAFEMVENFDRATAERTLGRLVHSLTPLAGAQRSVRDALDPMVRAPEGIGEQVAANIPALSEGVPARLDRLGREIQREGGPVRRSVDVFNVSRESDDRVLAELGRLGVRMGFPGEQVGRLELSRGQGRQVQQVKGGATYTVLQRLIHSTAYQRLTDAQKAEALEKAIDKTRGAAAKALRGRLIRPMGK
jgi:hypothetical protein